MKLRGLYLTSMITMTAASLIAIIFLALTLHSYDYEFPIYDDIKKNFIQNPISNIRVQISPCILPSSPLFDFQWPGISPYCSCWLYSYAGACTNKQRSSGCKNKGNISQAPLNKYKGVYICADRQNQDYDSMAEIQPDEQCQQGTKKCGTSSEGWNICFPANSLCPINDIIFSVSKREDLIRNQYKEIEIVYPSENSNVMNINNSITTKLNWFIYYSHSEISKPFVIQFNVGYKGNICLHPEEKLVPISQYKYLNDIEKYKKDCDSIMSQKYDNRYTYLDSYNQYNLWVENGFLPIMENLQDFDGQSLNYEFDIFKRGYIHINDLCRLDGSSKIYELKSQIIDMLSFKSIAYNKKAYFVTCFIALGFAILFGLIGMCSSCDSKSTTLCQWILSLITALLIIAALTLTILMYIKGTERSDKISKIYPKKCGDSLTNLAIEQSYNNSHRDAAYFLAIVGILGLGIVIFAIYTILKPYEKKSKKKHHKKSNDYELQTQNSDQHQYEAFDNQHDVGIYD
jgi:hypothetical protein